MRYRPCDVVNMGCKAPPGLTTSYTKATCFACGLPVCTGSNCSKLMRWYGYGVRRICSGCQEDAKKDVG